MKTKEWFRTRAAELYHEDGEIEVDSNARVSLGDGDGAYVQAWVWVPLPRERKIRPTARKGTGSLPDAQGAQRARKLHSSRQIDK
jgi:hypothetical protein